MGSYFGRNHSPKPSHQRAQSYTHSQVPSSPVSHSAPVLPPIPSIADAADDAPLTGLGLDTAFTFHPSPQQSAPSSSSNLSTPSPLRDAPAPAGPAPAPAVRPRSWQQGRAVTSPVGAMPSFQQTNMSPSSPLAALSVPYSSTTAQAKPRAGNRPLPAESTVNGVPQHAKTSKQRPELHSNKSSKGKFNLLNPVNLLMRRRSAQAVETLDKTASKNLAIPPMDLPDGYDPRIRGKVVHDFSAPRTRRTPSYDPSLAEASPKPSTANDSIKSQQDSGERDPKRQSVPHAPIFVEHIDSEPDQNRVHAETLANSDFIARNSWHHSGESLNMPPFGRRSQLLDDQSNSEPASDSPHSAMSAMSGPGWQYHEPERVYSPVSPEPTPEIISELGSERSEQESATEQEPQQSPSLLPNLASTLPRHMASTASRFSFQIANDSIAEEKLLEERHKLRQSSVAQAPPTFEHDEYEDDEEDEFDEDAMYDHDEMEDAPANGLYEHSNSGLPERLSGMNLSADQGLVSVDSSSALYSNPVPQVMQPAFQNPLRSNPPPGSSAETSLTESKQYPARPSSANSFYFDDGLIDQLDDVYEEDEEIEEVEDNSNETFDEDRFDDPSYLKRPNQPAHLQQAPTTSSIYSPPDVSVHDVNGHPFLIQNPETGHFSADSPFSEGSSQPSEQQQEAQEEAARHDSQQGPRDCHDMTAYHSALAEAAHRAAADGKFTRQNSIAASDSVYSEDYEQDADDHSHQQQYPQSQMPMPPPMQMQVPPYLQMQMPQLSPYQMQMQMQLQMQMQPQMRQSYMSGSTHASRGSYSAFDFGFSDGATIDDTFSSPEFPSDDFAFDDLDLISAANSEALANDEDGFYSQEFGFYARARPGGDSDTVEPINGGYFGAPGIEIIRQKSVKEPNLTPITERSEFSTRNSYIGPFSPLAAALPSPGFPPSHMAAARMSPLHWQHLQEDEMTLADLRRLKQGAFGSSSNSVNSMTSSFGVPAPYSPTMAAPNMPNGYFMPRASGGVPMAMQRSSDSNSNYNPSNHSSSPVPTSPVRASMSNSIANSQTLNSPLQPPHAFFMSDNPSTPKKSSSGLNETPGTPVTAKKAAPKDTAPAPERQPYQTHSRSGSGADNITYVREEDSMGGKRWVLERRRTSEAGLLELIGREVVEGGRI
jgi:hypothetical protein